VISTNIGAPFSKKDAKIQFFQNHVSYSTTVYQDINRMLLNRLLNKRKIQVLRAQQRKSLLNSFTDDISQFWGNISTTTKITIRIIIITPTLGSIPTKKIGIHCHYLTRKFGHQLSLSPLVLCCYY